MSLHDTTNEIPYGYCQCGCGNLAPIAKRTYNTNGHIKGQPVRFIKGHGNTKVNAPVLPNDFVLPPGTLAIPLTRGQFAIVDDYHYEWLSRWNWQARSSGTTFYAQRTERLPNGKRRQVQMHRLIMNVPQELDIDHIDGNGCNNTMHNLRLATRSENCCNKPTKNTNTSGYKGVSWHKQRGKWQASICLNQKITYLGLFDTAEEAARAYDVAALKVHGEFARLNSS